MSNVMRRFIIATAFGLLASGAIHAGPILEYTSATTLTPVSNVSAGWSFTTNQAITVTALDAWTGGGLSSYNVRLYDGSGNILASGTVLSSDPVEGSSGATFYSHTLTNSVTLVADTTYYIAEDTPANTPVNYLASGMTTNSTINYGKSVLTLGLGQNPTTDGTHTGPPTLGYFGPDFDATPASVPEPSSMILLGLVISVISIGAWLRRRRAKVAADS